MEQVNGKPPPVVDAISSADGAAQPQKPAMPDDASVLNRTDSGGDGPMEELLNAIIGSFNEILCGGITRSLTIDAIENSHSIGSCL